MDKSLSECYNSNMMELPILFYSYAENYHYVTLSQAFQLYHLSLLEIIMSNDLNNLQLDFQTGIKLVTDDWLKKMDNLEELIRENKEN